MCSTCVIIVYNSSAIECKKEKKIGFLPSCRCVNTTEQFHYMNKTLGEKVRWELHKGATCSSKQILEAACHKTAAI